MKVLITGANGFLGRAVVNSFRGHGYKVRALVRPSVVTQQLGWPDDVEIVRADLRVAPELDRAFDGIDLLVHLASVVVGDDTTHFAGTIGGTERLLDAMALSNTRRIILASSMSVYGWLESSRTVTEDTPPPQPLYEAGAYAVAKTWQERIARRMSTAHGWDLTVLRPGNIWGLGQDCRHMIGPSLKCFRFVIGPWRRLPLTFVENCADIFVRVAEDSRAIGQTFNVVDGHAITAWRYAGEISRRTGAKQYRIPVPYLLVRLNASIADLCRRLLFKKGGKLPGLLRPRQVAYMRPLKFSNRKLAQTLGWKPPVDFKKALQLCFGPTALTTAEEPPSQKSCSVADASGT